MKRFAWLLVFYGVMFIVFFVVNLPRLLTGATEDNAAQLFSAAIAALVLTVFFTMVRGLFPKDKTQKPKLPKTGYTPIEQRIYALIAFFTVLLFAIFMFSKPAAGKEIVHWILFVIVFAIAGLVIGYFVIRYLWVFILGRMGRYDLVIAHLTNLLYIFRRADEIYMVRALFLGASEKFHEAMADINRAIELAPHQNYEYYLGKASLLSILQQTEEAIMVYTDVIEHSPDLIKRANAYQNRCGLYLKTGDLDAALDDINAMETLNLPDKYQARWQSICLMRRGFLDLALEAYDDALKAFETGRTHSDTQENRIGQAVALERLERGKDTTAIWQTLIKENARFNDPEWVVRAYFLSPALKSSIEKIVARQPQV